MMEKKKMSKIEHNVAEELKGLSETISGLKSGPIKKEGRDKLTGLKRLLKLANHGINGKMYHDEFNIVVFNDKSDLKNCKTMGCMLGECPGLFREWVWNTGGDPLLKVFFSDDYDTSFVTWPPKDSAMQFFNINSDEFSQLFIPDSQTDLFSYKKCERLSRKATKEQVAENMLDFIQYKIREIETSINEESNG